ncbi:hypothetical protein D5S17_21080 [Pseudonocardiaceae bacterium YIM PH 21723]|nr:hypothetical protein D5S17_21080 [Pseudonocardiaceae bacterium YIM PH 21723]
MSMADALGELPEPELTLPEDAMGDVLRRIELRRSILAIAELDHAAETALVNAVVTDKNKKGEARRRG